MLHPITTSIWLCAEHYQEACTSVGYQIPVHLIANGFDAKCNWKDCQQTAEHEIDMADDWKPKQA